MSDNGYESVSQEIDDMHYDELKRGVKHFKEEGGRGQVCKAVEEYGKACAIRTQIEAVKNLMTNLKWNVDQAMQALNISEEDQIVIRGMIK